VTEVGIVTSDRPLQLLKAFLPIEVTEYSVLSYITVSGISTLPEIFAPDLLLLLFTIQVLAFSSSIV
jgi:hypothetical protein